jgi:hypothetical protein
VTLTEVAAYNTPPEVQPATPRYPSINKQVTQNRHTKTFHKFAFILEVHPSGHEGPEGEEVPVLLFNLGARWEWVVNVKFPPLNPRKRDPVPIVLQAG